MAIARRQTKNLREVAGDVAAEARTPVKEKARVAFIHSGLTTLNLALSGKGATGGWARGRIVNVVGDGSSGKTLLALELAARCINRGVPQSPLFPPVKKIKVVYNNVESVMDFPLEAMYGRNFASAVEWIQTPTVEGFGRDYARRVMSLKDGEFLLYILDSFDSLTSESGMKRFEDAARKDKAEDGSYGTEKAKYGSASFFNNICGLTEEKDATLFIISQVRENISLMSFGKKLYRAGGKALNFYTHQVCWLTEIEKLKRTYKSDTRSYGIRVRGRVERNKTAKPFREAEFTILFDYGTDDVGSNLAWLYGPEVKRLDWDGRDFSREELIRYIEANNLEDELARRVETEWNKIEMSIKPKRKLKYE